MARMVAIIKSHNKALVSFVPIPDYVMWREGVVSGVTVPSTFTKMRLDITTAFYNNDSTCCYALKDRLSSGEANDMRENVAWHNSIGVNVFTTDDPDSVDTFIESVGRLDKISIPAPKKPEKNMNSTLSWGLGYWPRPTKIPVNIKQWGGEESAFWNGQVCLWDNTYIQYAWTYACMAAPSGYSKKLFTLVVNDNKWSHIYGDLIQIYTHDGKYCLSSDYGEFGAGWAESCDSSQLKTLFVMDNEMRLGPLQDRVNNLGDIYLTADYAGLYWAATYGNIYTSYSGTSNWAKWAIVVVVVV